jgi:para-nitrobenzyl esterase
MRKAALALVFGMFLGHAALAAEPQIRIDQGMLSGTVEDGIEAFKGIPFAAAPIGPLRWRAPQPAPTWSGVRKADDFGPICPQVQRASFLRQDSPQSEDCLTVNVWTPDAQRGAKLPVMVWIYGGGFIQGSSAFSLYDGTDLAKHGVILVSFNYRLGALGFLAHPALEAEQAGEPGGNYGLLDQIAALAWVQKNIAAFGGDPANVTIFGESAGGVSVNDLMVSPMARGLFAKAISESGLGLEKHTTLAEAQDSGVAFAARMGVTETGGDALAELRAVKVEAILKDQGKTLEGAVSPFIDGKIIPEDVSLAFAKGHIAKVPYIAGSNSNEASLAPMIGLKPEAMLTQFGDKLADVRALYEQGGKLSDQEFGRQVFGDALFASGAQAFAGFAAQTGEPARVYQFGYVANYYRGKVPGVSHGGELLYVFGLRGLGLLGKFASDSDRAMVALVQNYWTNFAKTGDPNGAGLPVWPTFSDTSQQTLVFDDKTQAVADFRKGQVGVMEAGWAKREGLAAAP